MQRVVDANPADTGARLEVANLLNRMGKPEQAQTVAEALVRREPKNAAFLEAAFRAELGAKDLPAAEKTADALTAAYPDQSLGYHLSGLAAEAAGNEDAAIKDYQKALETQPSAREPLEALVRLYARTNKVPAALDVLHKAAESQPHNVLPTMLAGEIQLALKRYPEAIDSFQKALDLVPDWLPAYRGLAQAQLGQHNTDAAVQTLRSAQAKVHPADAAVFDLAGLYQQLGRPDAAIAAYEEALKINPRSDLAANNLAMLLVSRTDKASLDRALTLAQHFSDSSNARYVDTLGWVRFKRGETTNALPVLNKAVSLAPDAPAPRYHLAMAQLKSGQTETARSNLQQALKQGSTFEGASDAQLALSGLQAQAHADVPGR
jgi:tetratricopeptide (TPR) repeat protein